jgi:lipoate---protein ligase
MSETWRKLPFNTDSAGRQLALSESLLAQPITPTLYWYQARQEAFILGAGQKPEILDFAHAPEAYKRTSGGTLVLAGADLLSLDVALPPDARLASSDITRAYLWFAETWVAALSRLGVNSYIVEPDAARTARANLEAASPDEKLVKAVCFGTLSAYEVVAEDGRKIVGLAQIRRRTGSLLQAGVHLHFAPEKFANALKLSDHERRILAQQLGERATGLDEVISPTPTVPQIIAAFEEALLETQPVTLTPAVWSSAELELTARLEAEKFLPVTC